jgi:hypothetical protein
MSEKSGLQLRHDMDGGGTDQTGTLRHADHAHVLVTDHRMRGIFGLTCLGRDFVYVTLMRSVMNASFWARLTPPPANTTVAAVQT